MDLLDRLLGHDAWTTRQLLLICQGLSDDQLDRELGIGPGTIRRTLDHLIQNMEIWTRLMEGEDATRGTKEVSIQVMIERLNDASERLGVLARRISDQDAWDQTWLDTLEEPPRQKSYGTAIAHVITHGMHHRAQLLIMLRQCGVEDRPEGDVFSWESQR